MARKTNISIGEIDFAAKPASSAAIGAVMATQIATDRAIPADRPIPAEPGALTLDEFCRWARAGRTTAYAEIKAGRLRVVKVGRRTLVPMENARTWLAGLPEARAA